MQIQIGALFFITLFMGCASFEDNDGYAQERNIKRYDAGVDYSEEDPYYNRNNDMKFEENKESHELDYEIIDNSVVVHVFDQVHLSFLYETDYRIVGDTIFCELIEVGENPNVKYYKGYQYARIDFNIPLESIKNYRVLLVRRW